MPGRFGHHQYGDGHPLFWGLVFMLAVAAVVAIIVYFVLHRERANAARPVGPPTPRPGIDPAVEAARLRYAHGQLTREAYAQIVADLTGQPLAAAPPPPSATTAADPGSISET